jgi:hypothetical protein
MRAEIWLGDVLRALNPDGIGDVASRRVVARLLGFAEGDHFLPPDRPAVPEPRALRDFGAQSRTAPEEPPVPVGEPEIRLEPLNSSQSAGATRPGPGMPALVVGPSGLRPRKTVRAEAVPRSEPRHLTARPAHQGLLPPRSERAILQMMLSRPVPDGPVDVPALVDTIARGLPVCELPRGRVPTSRFGVQVLVDTGPAMVPFTRDQDALVERVRAVVGEHATVVRYFIGTPLRGCGDTPGAVPEIYRPPAAGGRVLLLSDLGLGGHAHVPDRPRLGEWTKFAALVRSRACTPVALLPVAPRRFPLSLRMVLTLVSWDRSTTASRVRTAAPWQ